MPLAAAALALALAAPGDCAALAAEPLPGGRFLSAKAEGGACKVVAERSAGPGSRIGIHVWLPLQGWSGRYVQLGTGGFAGTIPAAALAAEAARGNAVAVTDTGHQGEDGFDARWAAGQPQKVIDYGYRSLRVTAELGQALTARFYGQPARRRYFVGCSNGGRQAIVAAERYPTLFDGVLAGAPAVAWTAQLSSFARIQAALRRPGGAIPAAMLPAIQAAARSGRASAMGRRAGLTAPQAAALALIARDFDPAYAATPGGWDRWILGADDAGGTQATLAEGFFRHFVLNRPGWRVTDLAAGDLERARALSPILDASGDLSAFRRRGGKLVIYTGLADPVISPRSAIAYHARAGAEDFSRLFLIPGMLHCQGGPQPDAFGQSHVSPPLRGDAEHDIRLALEAWVEVGRAPEAITAAKYVGDDPAQGAAATARILATRPVQPDRRRP
jgi:feruloyl esterase